MKRITFFLMFLLFAAMPYSAFAQELSQKEIEAQALADYGVTKEAMEQYNKDIMINLTRFQEEMQAKIMAQATQPGFSQEKAMDIVMESMIEMGDIMRETSQKHFNEEQHQKMQLRMFQMLRSITDDAIKTDDPAAATVTQGTAPLELMMGPPDFLNLTDGQKKEILEVQKETTKAIQLTSGKHMQSIMANPEELKKLQEMQELAGKVQKAETDEERQETARKLLTIHSEMFKDVAPEFKKILKEGREKYDAILTDAQRAKIKATMEQIPEYLWQSLPQNQGKNRSWRPGLNSWIPGMGAPEGTENIREAKPEPKEKSRRFPGND